MTPEERKLAVINAIREPTYCWYDHVINPRVFDRYASVVPDMIQHLSKHFLLDNWTYHAHTDLTLDLPPTQAQAPTGSTGTLPTPEGIKAADQRAARATDSK